MITKSKSLLEIVEDYPERESIIRAYDATAGACLLCQNLFDRISDIEHQYSIDLTDMVDKLNAK
jgi:hypothetical protein